MIPKHRHVALELGRALGALGLEGGALIGRHSLDQQLKVLDCLLPGLETQWATALRLVLIVPGHYTTRHAQPSVGMLVRRWCKAGAGRRHLLFYEE
jgi:hypothetical protein